MTQPYGSSPDTPHIPPQPQYQPQYQPQHHEAPQYQQTPPQAPYQGVPAQPYAPQPYAPQQYAPAQYPVPQGPRAPMPYKDSTAAWLLWFFTGSVGGHHFYLGNTQRGVVYAVTFGVSFLLSFVLIGFIGLLVLFILWIVDATQLSSQLNAYNARAYANNQALGVV
jgi:TM2 domain-containing membrane protein YozV